MLWRTIPTARIPIAGLMDSAPVSASVNYFTVTGFVSIAGESANMESIKKQLKMHEGVRHTVYLDTTGHRTIGCGFNLDREESQTILLSCGIHYEDIIEGKSLTETQIDQLLDFNIHEAKNTCYKLFLNFDFLPSVVQKVLIDLAFNLGERKLSGFKKFIFRINRLEYAKAALCLRDSKWFWQVGYRGIRLCAMLQDNLDIPALLEKKEE